MFLFLTLLQVPQMFQTQLEELLRYPPAGTEISKSSVYRSHGQLLAKGRMEVELGLRSVYQD
jgi:hypothetical protein